MLLGIILKISDINKFRTQVFCLMTKLLFRLAAGPTTHIAASIRRNIWAFAFNSHPKPLSL